MIHKLLAGKGKMKRGLSLLLCLALLGCSVISTNVTAEAESDATVETVDTAGNETDDAETVDETTEEAASETAETTEETGTDVAETPTEDTSDEGTLMISLSDDTDTDEQSSDTDDTSGADSNDGIMLTAGEDDWGDWNKPGESGGSTKSISVYYDRVIVGSSNGSATLTAQNDSEGIYSVSISGGGATNDGVVAHENGKATSWSATTTSLTYTDTSTETVTLTVVPTAGYYITYITICCTGMGSSTVPTSCTTWGDGDAYSSNYSISDEGTITISVNLNQEKGFKHSSNASIYFVLIETAKIPSPLYVEYQYGDIVDYIDAYNKENSTSLSSDVFTGSADTWTDTDDRNSYGTADEGVINGVMTNDTQYKYTYENGSNSSEAEWVHYANSITEEALAQAAAAGYYFVGWEATYYTTCTETTNASGEYNNYTYSFSSQYGTTADYYQPGDDVELTVHVLLIAKWVKVEPTPGTITITKSFEGLETDKYPTSITFTVTGSTVDETVELTSDNNWTATVSNLNPGTYTVTETSGYAVSGYECSTDINVSVKVNGEEVSNTSTTNTSTTVTLGYKVTTTYDSSTNTNSYTVTTYDADVAVTNTYTASPVSLSVKKLVSGNMGDTSKNFSFTLSVKDSEGNAYISGLSYKLNGGDESTMRVGNDGETYTFTLSHNDTIVFTEIPYGYSIVVEEASYGSDGYETTYTVDGGTVQNKSTYENAKITADTTLVFTNDKTISAPTGLTTDVAPYVAALAIALGGAVLMFISRRRRV